MSDSVLRLVSLCAVLGLTGCLENLNQQKYFAQLEAKAPDLARRVRAHRGEIEAELRRTLTEKARPGVTHIGLWGETWDVVRRPTDGQQLFMRGRIFHEVGPSSTYYAAFSVAEDGALTFSDQRVFGVGDPE